MVVPIVRRIAAVAATDDALEIRLAAATGEARVHVVATRYLAPFDLLRHYPRFTRAMSVRSERLAANYGKDQRNQELLSALREPLDVLLAAEPAALEVSEAVRQYWFMLEEFAVSLYAQHLGTSAPVSEKRLRALWDTVQARRDAAVAPAR